MRNREFLRYVGNSDQVYGVRRIQCAGRSYYEVDTGGGLCFDVCEEQCLDIARLKFRGVNVSYLCSNGLGRAMHPFEEDFYHTFPGGMLYTCGLMNAGDANRCAGVWQPMHGRIHDERAQNACAYWDEAQDALVIRGVMHESALYGQHLSLTRTITAPVGGGEIRLDDRIDNLTPEQTGYMITYHINFGYPFLSEHLRLVLPQGTRTAPENEWAAEGLERCCEFKKPADGEAEQVYFHRLPAQAGWYQVSMDNPCLGVRASLSATADTLPNLIEWKSMHSGDYALGLEPSNNLVMGRTREGANGTLVVLPPYGSAEMHIRLAFLPLGESPCFR